MKTYFFTFFLLVSVTAYTQKTNLKSRFNPFQIEYANSYEWADDILSIDAGPKTNLFITHDKTFNVALIPMLYTEPDSDFMLQAKVETNHLKTWDAGVIMVYVNENYWAKLCFEKSVEGPNRIVSVVNNIVSDDCNSDIIEGSLVFLRVVKLGKSFRFSFSTNGKDWHVVRYFTLNEQYNLKAGLASQSPVGEHCLSEFSDIEFTTTEIREYWDNKK
jgi:uncharacterized protein